MDLSPIVNMYQNNVLRTTFRYVFFSLFYFRIYLRRSKHEICRVFKKKNWKILNKIKKILI